MKAPKYDKTWSEEVQALYQHDMEQYWDSTLSIHQWNQYKNLLSTYLSIPSPTEKMSVLDVGCAQATLALLLAEQGHNMTAVDIRQESLDYAVSRYEHGDINFVRGNVLELKLDRKFDLIFANQIVEHLVYPGEMIQRLSQLLTSEGRLVISTPNWKYIKNNLPSYEALGDPKKWEHKQFTADGDGHFFAYKEAELIELFQRNAFSSVEVKYFETPVISGHMKFRYMHKLLPYKILSAVDRAILKIPMLKQLMSHQIMVIGSR